MRQLYIDGEWVDADATEGIDVVSPVTGETIDTVPQASDSDVAAAVSAATRAQRELEEMTAYERADVLGEVTEYFEEHEDEIARQITEEEGKPLHESYEETEYVIESSDDYAHDAIRLFGDVVPSEHRDRFAYTQREPYGPCAVISPWNFPLEVPGGSIYSAVATANPVVFKPAEETPLTAYHIAEAFDRSSLPDGAFNLVTGDGETGASLVGNRDIRLIAFTGSSAVGQEIAKVAAERNAQCLLEMGGKDPIVVLDDADVDHAAESIVVGSNWNAGQVCCATERVIATEGVHDELVDAIVEKTEELVLGDPFEEGVDVGPMISQRIQRKAVNHLEDAVDKGATVKTGGGTDGLYFEPAVVDDVTEEMDVSSEETFGPVTPVITASSYDEAIEIANRSPYGLQAAVFTDSLERAHDAANRIKAGGVFVNETNNYWERLLPFGGYKESGSGGRYGSKWHLESMTQTKSVMMNYGGGE
ncbi:aldehyde dehydrogenase (NAD+) [Halopelagius inordinatus]|uniref:Aldehyde dehydrogenase (NAD+) n=1 Tax=Halopelagius inordinatus TaxID=553467 RepID=A0A1I2S6P6_9EURY|nr:aldehyde dehydrogenase family protein [Halopelagius inordinatus]SFG48430.1 aldehyde dehydrogenase (NAD+) [Halopelagius inordinatus]